MMSLLFTIYYRIRYRLLRLVQTVHYHADGCSWAVASYAAVQDVHRLWEKELREAEEELERPKAQEGEAA